MMSQQFVERIERKLLKIFLLSKLRSLICEEFAQNMLSCDKYCLNLVYHNNDCQFSQFIIQQLLASEAYTLQGLAHYSSLSCDSLEEAFYNNYTSFSLISWARIIALYLQTKPELIQTLLKTLLKADAEEAPPHIPQS